MLTSKPAKPLGVTLSGSMPVVAFWPPQAMAPIATAASTHCVIVVRADLTCVAVDSGDIRNCTTRLSARRVRPLLSAGREGDDIVLVLARTHLHPRRPSGHAGHRQSHELRLLGQQPQRDVSG